MIENKLEEARANQKEIVEQVKKIADEIESLREKRWNLAQEALRYDGEIRALQAILQEGKTEEPVKPKK